jgi:hypothetical protein
MATLLAWTVLNKPTEALLPDFWQISGKEAGYPPRSRVP